MITFSVSCEGLTRAWNTQKGILLFINEPDFVCTHDNVHGRVLTSLLYDNVRLFVVLRPLIGMYCVLSFLTSSQTGIMIPT